MKSRSANLTPTTRFVKHWQATVWCLTGCCGCGCGCGGGDGDRGCASANETSACAGRGYAPCCDCGCGCGGMGWGPVHTNSVGQVVSTIQSSIRDKAQHNPPTAAPGCGCGPGLRPRPRPRRGPASSAPPPSPSAWCAAGHSPGGACPQSGPAAAARCLGSVESTVPISCVHHLHNKPAHFLYSSPSPSPSSYSPKMLRKAPQASHTRSFCPWTRSDSGRGAGAGAGAGAGGAAAPPRTPLATASASKFPCSSARVFLSSCMLFYLFIAIAMSAVDWWMRPSIEEGRKEGIDPPTHPPTVLITSAFSPSCFASSSFPSSLALSAAAAASSTSCCSFTTYMHRWTHQ